MTVDVSELLEQTDNKTNEPMWAVYAVSLDGKNIKTGKTKDLITTMTNFVNENNGNSIKVMYLCWNFFEEMANAKLNFLNSGEGQAWLVGKIKDGFIWEVPKDAE